MATAVARSAQAVNSRQGSSLSTRARRVAPAAAGSAGGSGALRQSAASRSEGRRSMPRLAVVRPAGGPAGRCMRRRPAASAPRQRPPRPPAPYLFVGPRRWF